MAFTTILIAITIILITIIARPYNLKNYVTDKLHMYNTVKNLPGPKYYPLVGNMFSFCGNLKGITNTLLTFYKTYKLPGRIWVGLKLFVVVDDPKHIKIIEDSNHANDKSEIYELFNPIFGNGLISTSASTAKNHRSLLYPIFYGQIVSTYIEKVVKNSNTLVRVVESFNKREIDILKYIQLCNVTMIYDIFLGKDLNLLENQDFKFIHRLSRIIDTSIERAYKFWLHPDFIFYNLSIGKTYAEDLSYFHKINNEVIGNYKESRDKINSIEKSIEENAGTNCTPFLKTLFKSFYEGGEYTEQDIRDEMKNVILAGSDTSTNAITFALVMLASYPAIQEELYQELYNIYGSTDVEDILITYEDIKEMSFLERFVKETLRVFPSIPFIGRRVSEDIKVNDDFTIPKNSTVGIFLYALHHNKKAWKNPEEFNPDRFLPGNYNPDYFKPFSYGRRSCIGQKLAVYQMKIIIATILRKFIVKIDNPKNVEDIRFIFGLTTKTSETFLLRFINR